MSTDGSILLVQALYSFSGKNNDELRFKRGDVITVTQKEEGGWWEGTLEEKTGWFPSNYVKEYIPPPDGSKSPISPSGVGSETSSAAVTPDPLSPQSCQQQKMYRKMVLRDIVESEHTHVSELKAISSSYLNPLQKSDLLSTTEYNQLVGNLEEVVSVHLRLAAAFEEQGEKSSREQRIGGAMLGMIPLLQTSHKSYCGNHPKAVCMLEKYKEELNSFMESQGAVEPGIMVLTTALSQPFRRLDKYSGMLQEYQRHMEEGHPDRGDTQRSSHIVRELVTNCGSIRRQKELELEVVTGQVQGWDGGETLGSLGELQHMGSVALMPDHRDHYLVLFPNTLVILGVSPRMSAFIFQGKYPLANIHVNLLEDGDNYKNAFEVTSSVSDHIIAVCQSREDQQQWVELLHQHSSRSGYAITTTHTPPPIPPAHNVSLLHRQNSILSNGRNPCNKLWSLSCLRPSPPLRPGPPLSSRDDKKTPKHAKKRDDKWHEEDALILRVIEAYCTSAKTRYTVNSTFLDTPQIIIAEEEKIIIEEQRGNELVMEEKSLVDTVYALKDQLTSLEKQYSDLRKEFDGEKQSSSYLRSILKQHVFAGRTDVKLELEP